MKKQMLIVVFLIAMLGVTVYGCKIPALSTLADCEINRESEKLVGRSVKDCIDCWGTSEQTWETEDGQNGYLWFYDKHKTTIILYSDSRGMITSIAISREAPQ